MFQISDDVERKIREKHGVAFDEIIECFINRTGRYLRDTREQHRTTPPTEWFIAETDEGRRLKIVFMQYPDAIVIKTAYEPDPEEERIYAEKT